MNNLKTKRTKEQIKKAIETSDGMKTTIARKLDVSRTTLDKYLKRYSDLENLLQYKGEETLDLAESKLISLITEGNLTAIIFYLKCKGRKRGFIDKDIDINKQQESEEIMANMSKLSIWGLEQLINNVPYKKLKYDERAWEVGKNE